MSHAWTKLRRVTRSLAALPDGLFSTGRQPKERQLVLSDIRRSDADHALTATFRYFFGFHSRASRCALGD
jgi:hypothetical protein